MFADGTDANFSCQCILYSFIFYDMHFSLKLSLDVILLVCLFLTLVGICEYNGKITISFRFFADVKFDA